VKLELREITNRPAIFDKSVMTVGEILLFRVARHVGERQNGDRLRLGPRLRLGSAGRYVTAIPEANVDPIADALCTIEETQIPPGSATGSKRAAMLTPSP
jgi:hypothetical protein